jgi:hypothetical protein
MARLNGREAVLPPACIGVWRRTLLRTPALEDTASTVYWLQTSRWHADIRIPADRPPMTGKSALDALTREELRALARQQGFCGVTEVEADICRWHRRVDFQPPSGFDDVGRMAFESADRCLEYGVEQDYVEIWERLPGSTGETLALELPGARPLRLLRAGDYAMCVRGRLDPLPQAANLVALAAGADDATLRRLLDFEISFAARDPDGRWEVRHSTLPWREGAPLEGADALAAAEAGSLAQTARHWQRLD